MNMTILLALTISGTSVLILKKVVKQLILRRAAVLSSRQLESRR